MDTHCWLCSTPGQCDVLPQHTTAHLQRRLLCTLCNDPLCRYVLAKFAERYDSNSYGQLIRRALGRKTAAGLSAVLLVYLWGSCVAYLVSVGVWVWV